MHLKLRRGPPKSRPLQYLAGILLDQTSDSQVLRGRLHLYGVSSKVGCSTNIRTDLTEFLNGHHFHINFGSFSNFHNASKMLYLVGLGLSDETDITVKGLEIVKKASRVYLEAYTSILLVDQTVLVSPSSGLEVFP